MKHLLTTILMVLALTVAKESLALSCVLADGNATSALQETVPSKISIPPLTPVGTIVWRSKDYDLDVICWHTNIGVDDYIYIFLGSYSSSSPIYNIGNQLQPGIRLRGVDYLCSSIQAQGGCGINTWRGVFACNNTGGCFHQTTRFRVQFSTFLAVKTLGTPGQAGSVVISPPPPVYPLAQFRGLVTPTSSHESNLTLLLTGLGNFQYIGCSSAIDVSPRLIDFKQISSSTAQAGTTAKELPFTITATKSCSTPYGLAGNFQPVSGNLTADNNTLVPTNNNSVGIQIIDKDTNRALPFKQDFFIAPTTNTNLVHQKNLAARLVWMKNTATLGNFSATARLDVYYK